MRTIHVEVTAIDIERGTPMVATACPVALALQRLIADPVRVDDDDININAALIDAPPTVREFVEAFDSERIPVKPFTFDLDIPDWVCLKEKTA